MSGAENEGVGSGTTELDPFTASALDSLNKVASELLIAVNGSDGVSIGGKVVPWAEVGLAEEAVVDAMSSIVELHRALQEGVGRRTLHVVFDGPPGEPGGSFVECQNAKGARVSNPAWFHRDDGFWALVVPLGLPPEPKALEVEDVW